MTSFDAWKKLREAEVIRTKKFLLDAFPSHDETVIDCLSSHVVYLASVPSSEILLALLVELSDVIREFADKVKLEIEGKSPEEMARFD